MPTAKICDQFLYLKKEKKNIKITLPHRKNIKKYNGNYVLSSKTNKYLHKSDRQTYAKA